MGARVAVGDGDPRVVATTLQRMKLGVSLELVGISVGLAVSQPAGIPLPAWIIVVNVIALAVAFAVVVMLHRRVFPVARLSISAAAVWAIAPITTLTSLATNGNHNLIFPLMIELALAGIVQTNVRALIASTALVAAAYSSLTLHAVDADTLIHISSVWGLTGAAWFVGREIRRSLDTASLRDDEQLATAALLKRELEERRRAESEREGIRDQFVHAQRMDAVGTLSAGLAHDMNNIIAGILGLAEVAAEEAAEPARADLQAIAREATRAADLTRSLLAYSRRGQYRRTLVALDAVVDEVEPLLSRMFANRVTLERRGGADVVIDADGAQLGQAIVNLCINGADAMEGRGALTITTAVVHHTAAEAARHGLGGGTFAMIAVRDTGRGMDDAVKARIFEPFYTTKPIGKGTGLGLAMVYGTVQGHGGAIIVDSAPNAGSTFTIYLPASTSPIVARTVTSRDSSKVRVAPRLALVVDDEPVVRAVATRILRQMGLSVVGASDGAEALVVFEARRDEISLVVLDMSMPVMNGADCFREIRRKSGVPIVIASGFANEAETQSLLAQGNTVFLEKPFSVDAMRGQIQRILDGLQ